MSKHMLTAATIFGFDARKMEWKELKASPRLMLTQLGPMWPQRKMFLQRWRKTHRKPASRIRAIIRGVDWKRKTSHGVHRKYVAFRPLCQRKKKSLQRKAVFLTGKKLRASAFFTERCLLWNCVCFLTNEEMYSWETQGLDFKVTVTRCF